MSDKIPTVACQHLVFEKSTGAVCRVVCYDEIVHRYIITLVSNGGGGEWNDTNYKAVKASELDEISGEDYEYLYKTGVFNK